MPSDMLDNPVISTLPTVDPLFIILPCRFVFEFNLIVMPAPPPALSQIIIVCVPVDEVLNHASYVKSPVGRNVELEAVKYCDVPLSGYESENIPLEELGEPLDVSV